MLSRFSAVDGRQTSADAGFGVIVIRHFAFDAKVSIPIAANKLSYPWHRKDPQVHGRARPKTHSQDLRAKVAGLYAHFVVAVAPPSDVVRHLGGDEAVAVAQ